MPIVLQSGIQVKFVEEIFKETDEKRGELLATFPVDFCSSISREIGHKKFHTNSSSHQDLKFHTAEPTFFHSDIWEMVGPNKSPKIQEQQKSTETYRNTLDPRFRTPPQNLYVGVLFLDYIERGEKTPPHPQDFSLTKKTARFTKGQFRPYSGPKTALLRTFLW